MVGCVVDEIPQDVLEAQAVREYQPGLDIDDATLERVNNYLRELVQGQTLREVRNLLAGRLANEQDQYEVLRRHARAMVEATVWASSA